MLTPTIYLDIAIAVLNVPLRRVCASPIRAACCAYRGGGVGRSIALPKGYLFDGG